MNSFTAENSQVPEMQQNLELLQQVPYFANFPSKALKLLSFLGERALLNQGDTLFEEGDDRGRAYLIVDGALTLLKPFATEDVIVQHFSKGDFVGFGSLLGPMPALFTLQATAKTTVLTISRKQFSKILEQFPETSKISLQTLVKEMYQWERKNMHKAAPCCLSRTGVTAL